MPIPQASFILFFVNNPFESGIFYRRLLSLEPVEESPTFVLFALPNGLMLGLWSRATARPVVQASGGGSEICFSEESDAKVDDVYNRWLKLGIPMAQSPLAMDGMSRTFVALDPDGHRIRVLCLERS
ncbi:VOC family protein [Candidatus Protochlamydia phocaeensis]|uniref:VOC family protein n=1 Tax=Candidatus Protochlamydia phocaeensis TaxID=1414722 RepID=UPI0008395DD7|nr:VOC family protein [Candidatus Protochlamydia phocaeensis]